MSDEPLNVKRLDNQPDTPQEREMAKRLKEIADVYNAPMVVNLVFESPDKITVGVFTQQKILGEMAVDAVTKIAECAHEAIDNDFKVRLTMMAVQKFQERKANEKSAAIEWADVIEEHEEESNEK